MLSFNYPEIDKRSEEVLGCPAAAGSPDFFGITSPVDDIFSANSPSPDHASSPDFRDGK